MATINLLPKEKELKELSIQFNEGCRLLGYHATILIPDSVDVPEYGYKLTSFYDTAKAFDAYVSIDSNPSPRQLSTLGWNIESSENKPIVCRIAKYLQPIDKDRKVLTKATKIYPVQYTKISLDYSYNDIAKEFIVTKVLTNTITPTHYVMTIVPYRPQVPVNEIEGQDPNTKRLNLENVEISCGFIHSTLSFSTLLKFLRIHFIYRRYT